jgi:hypothetical protein
VAVAAVERVVARDHVAREDTLSRPPHPRPYPRKTRPAFSLSRIVLPVTVTRRGGSRIDDRVQPFQEWSGKHHRPTLAAGARCDHLGDPVRRETDDDSKRLVVFVQVIGKASERAAPVPLPTAFGAR